MPDGKSISRPQTNREAIQGGTALDVFARKPGTSESISERMAISASVDSDSCRFAAIAANRRFSCGVGRAVIDGAVAFEGPSFAACQSVLLQIADTSLSCHHSNNDPTTLLNLSLCSYPICQAGMRPIICANYGAFRV